MRGNKEVAAMLVNAHISYRLYLAQTGKEQLTDAQIEDELIMLYEQYFHPPLERER